MAATSKPFLTDVTELRRRAREHMAKVHSPKTTGATSNRPSTCCDGAGNRNRLRAAL